STSNRTLDQQCTVTRPGLAPIASSLAVELLVGMVHHPRGLTAEAEFDGSPLGTVPHQIRGSLFEFSQSSMIGYASSTCTACSYAVVDEYRKRGLDFVVEAMSNPTYLEDLTGLTSLNSSSAHLDWADDDDDDECYEL
ncbi:hypothetical protein M569_11013, partial [Genlisea aurea]